MTAPPLSVVCPTCWYDEPVTDPTVLDWLSAHRGPNPCPRCLREGATYAESHQGAQEARGRVWISKATRMSSAGVPRRCVTLVASGAILERTVWTEAVQSARDLATQVVLSGRPGSGKSIAAAVGLLREAGRWDQAKRRMPAVRWVTPQEMIRLGVYDDAMTDILKADAIVLDDIGQEYGDKGGFSAAVLGCLLSAAYDNESVVLMTTNLSAQDFSRRYGGRIADRLREVGCFVERDAPSLRGAAPPRLTP